MLRLLQLYEDLQTLQPHTHPNPRDLGVLDQELDNVWEEIVSLTEEVFGIALILHESFYSTKLYSGVYPSFK